VFMEHVIAKNRKQVGGRNSNSLWLIEMENTMRGGVATANKLFRLKHVASGKYLAATQHKPEDILPSTSPGVPPLLPHTSSGMLPKIPLPPPPASAATAESQPSPRGAASAGAIPILRSQQSSHILKHAGSGEMQHTLSSPLATPRDSTRNFTELHLSNLLILHA